jgi:type IV pilus assembly protein PilV
MKTFKKRINGFTLIEVMISVLILGIGILGILNLQSRALMDNQDAYIRTQANFLLNDMSDRVRANHQYWQEKINSNAVILETAYKFCNVYDPTSGVDSVATPPILPTECSYIEIAKYDMYRWKKEVEDQLPNGEVAITRDFDLIHLKVSWSRVNQDLQAEMGNKASVSMGVRP